MALIFSYVETLIPISFGIPGVKLGLANLVIVIALYKIRPGEALLLSVTRVALAGFIFGNYFSIIYSLAVPVLLAAGAITGFFIGILAEQMLRRLRNIQF